jgi:hypothetical protein
MALSQHCHVIFDATNRTDGGRAGAYAAASEFNAQVSVVFVKANQETLSARYMAANSEKRKAFDKLGNQVYSYGNCSMPYQVINSNKSEFEMLKELNKFIKIPINFLF